MHILLSAINTDRQTRLLNVFGQIEMFWEIKKKVYFPGKQTPGTH